MERNNRKRGFTLVELIVVLVNLAVLAALLVPSLTGYIDKAKKKAGDIEVKSLQPIHLVLIEEPEAHLHAQVQQVFIKHAYDI